jgi:putative lipoic acid-binding regulatory protein
MSSVYGSGDKLMPGSNQSLPKEDLLEFPCQFEIKAMGRRSPEFEGQISAIVNRHLSGAPILGTRARCSRQGRYVSVTCVIHAASREQLDAIYLDLNSEPEVLMTL